MPLELLQNTTELVEFTPDIRCDSASVVLYSPSGSVLAEVDADPDALDEVEVASVGASPDILTLVATDNVLAGRDYWYESVSGWGCRVRVSEVNSTTKVVTLESPPEGAPQEGDLLQGLTFSASIPSTALATRSTKPHRLDWTMTRGAETRRYRQAAFVVGMRFRAPAEAADVVRAATANFASWARTQKVATWHRIAAQASERVAQELIAVEDYPWLLGDHSAFRAAGEIAIRLELAQLSRVPPGNEVGPYVTAQEELLARAIRKAIGGMANDRNDNGVVDPREVESIRTIQIQRV